MMTLALIIVVYSSFMYFVEHDAQPDKFSSIPAAMWWSVTTTTTVGYGDVFPSPHRPLFNRLHIHPRHRPVCPPAGILASGFPPNFKNSKRKTRVPTL